MKDFVAVYCPTGYYANGEKIPCGKFYGLYEEPTFSLISAQSKAEAKAKARLDASSIYDINGQCNNPPVVNIFVDYLSPNKWEIICGGYEDFKARLEENADKRRKIKCRIDDLEQQIAALEEIRFELKNSFVDMELKFNDAEKLFRDLQTLRYLGIDD